MKASASLNNFHTNILKDIQNELEGRCRRVGMEVVSGSSVLIGLRQSSIATSHFSRKRTQKECKTAIGWEKWGGVAVI